MRIVAPMRTTIDLPDPLFHRAKRIAAQRRVSLKRLIADTLESALDTDTLPTKRMSQPPIRLGIPSTIPNLSNREAAAILDQEDRTKLNPK